MNLRSLGATLATITKDNQDQSRILTDVINKVQEVLDLVQDAQNSLVDGYEEAGGTWSDTEPDEWHCASCKANDAPIEDLSMEEMFEYIEKNHPDAYMRESGGRLLDRANKGQDFSYIRNATESVFKDARKAANPAQWDTHGEEPEV